MAHYFANGQHDLFVTVMQKGNLSIQLKHSYSFHMFLFFLRRIITCWGYVIYMPCAWSMTKPEIAKGTTSMPTLRNSERDWWFQCVQSGRLPYCFAIFQIRPHEGFKSATVLPLHRVCASGTRTSVQKVEKF